MLEASRIGHGARAKDETNRHSGDGREVDAVASEEVIRGLNERREDDDRNARKGLDHVIRDAAEIYLARLRNEVIVQLSDAEVKDK